MSNFRIRAAFYLAALVGGHEYMRSIAWTAAVSQYVLDTVPQAEIDSIVESFMLREGML